MTGRHITTVDDLIHAEILWEDQPSGRKNRREGGGSIMIKSSRMTCCSTIRSRFVALVWMCIQNHFYSPPPPPSSRSSVVWVIFISNNMKRMGGGSWGKCSEPLMCVLMFFTCTQFEGAYLCTFLCCTENQLKTSMTNTFLIGSLSTNHCILFY